MALRLIRLAIDTVRPTQEPMSRPVLRRKVGGAKLSAEDMVAIVADAMGLFVAVEITDGSQPVGCGMGPALEAREGAAR